MDSILCYVAVGILAIIMGLLVALPSLIPPLRRAARRNRRVRMSELAALGLLSLFLTFAAWNFLNAAYDALWIAMGGGDFGAYTRAEDAFTTEIWLRHMALPSPRQPCYTGSAAACQLADDYIQRLNPSSYTWPKYLLSIGMALVAALTTGAGVWRFTRPRQPDQAVLIASSSSPGDGA